MSNFSTHLTKHNINAVAIGHFDGIHQGHKRLLSELGDFGALVVIDKNTANITPKQNRANFASHPCFFYDFEKVKPLSGEEFVALLKKDFVNLKKIVVGYDFKFGRNRAWDKDDLARIFDGEVVVVPQFCINGKKVHSTEIREFLSQGDIQMANEFLGRRYTIEGKIVRGQGIGAKDLVATLNLEV
nr:bifunctional riboflavin kinase/FAD synthetase [Campylobacter sp.]